MIKKLFYLFCTVLVTSGCNSNYYTLNDFRTIKKVDSHVHINSNNGIFENQAIKDNFILLTLNVDHSDSLAVEKQLEESLVSVRKYPGRVFYGATFYFDTTGWGTDKWAKKVILNLEKAIKEGAVTVKIWKNIGMTEKDRSGRFIMIDDPGLDPVINYIAERGLPITGHLGEPRNCWLPLSEMTVRGDSSYFAENPQYHMFLHPEYPSYEDQINARDHMLQKHPELSFIGCHLGSLEWNVDSLAERLDRFPNMAVDMAARICHLEYQSARNRERVRNFCIKYQDRLLYGTDLSTGETGDTTGTSNYIHKTWLDDWRYFTTSNVMSSDAFSGTFRGLQLPREVIDKIYHTNAVKWYKLPE